MQPRSSSDLLFVSHSGHALQEAPATTGHEKWSVDPLTLMPSLMVLPVWTLPSTVYSHLWFHQGLVFHCDSVENEMGISPSSSLALPGRILSLFITGENGTWLVSSAALLCEQKAVNNLVYPRLLAHPHPTCPSPCWCSLDVTRLFESVKNRTALSVAMWERTQGVDSASRQSSSPLPTPA